MGYTQQRGASRQHCHTDLEEITAKARQEKPSNDEVRRAKEARERKAQRKLKQLQGTNIELTRFPDEIDADAKVTVAFSLCKAIYEAALGKPEATRLQDIEILTDARIFRLDEINMVFRGRPAAILEAQKQIQTDLSLFPARKTAVFPQ